nr:serine/threonine-protein kinase [Streptomyces zhaozhouensis]
MLGEGGMGRVLLATGPDGALVAIKMVRAHLAGDEEFRRRFRREVTATRKVAGETIAPVVHADPDADIPWLASKFVHGPSLREVLEEGGTLPQDAVLRLAAGLASALRDIHDAGLVHRDLSPSNVLLAEDGPKVIDFGIVRAVEGAATAHHNTMTTTLTHVGSVIGAPGFMSPEQARGQALAPATDVFSLGVMLFVAHTGRNPFEGPDIPQILYNVVHTEPDLTPLPDPLRRIIEPCLAKDHTQRPHPTRLLELISAEAEAEAEAGPQAPSPWPEVVQRLTERQRAELSRHINATNDTAEAPPHAPSAPPQPQPPLVPPQIMSAPEPAPLTQTPRPAPQPPDPRRGTRSRRRLLIAASVLALIVFAWAGVIFINIQAQQDDDTDPGDTAVTAGPAIRNAEEGDCFENQGTMRDVDLTSMATCEDGAFETLRVIHGPADPAACDGTPLNDLTSTYPEDDLTLCLTYLHEDGATAYHAREGDCVDGVTGSGYSRWSETECANGSFTVVERLEGTSDDAGCDRSRPGTHSHAFTVDAWQSLDVVLCLSINYGAGDVGYAEPGDCLHRYGPEGDRSYEFADCGSDDAMYVTRRAPTYYDDPDKFCGDDIWIRFDAGLPELSYTVCLRHP